MKKILLLLVVVFTSTTFIAKAETGIETLQACITAMKIDKLDSFKTFSIKAYMYAQGQKVSIKFFNKEFGEGDDAESKSRFEQSVMGKETAIVLTEDEIFQVVPSYEEIDKDDAGQLFQMISWLIPHNSIKELVKDTTGKLIFQLVEGTAKFNSKNCKKVGLATSEKPDEVGQYFFLDEATNWFQGLEIPSSAMSLVVDNFKKAKGFVYPTTIKLLKDGKKLLEVEVDNFEVNIDLDDALFAKTK